MADILTGLAADLLPLGVASANFGYVFLELKTVQMLLEQAVVTPMKGDAMVIDNATRINHALEISISLVLVQFEL